MKIKRILGVSIMATIFLSLFVFGVVLVGLKGAIISFISGFALIALIILSMWLITEG